MLTTLLVVGGVVLSYLLITLIISVVVGIVAPANPDISPFFLGPDQVQSNAQAIFEDKIERNVNLVGFLSYILWLPVLILLLGWHFGKKQPQKGWLARFDLSPPSWQDVGFGVMVALALAQLVAIVTIAMDWLGLGDVDQLQELLITIPEGGLELLWFVLAGTILVPIIEEIIFRRWIWRWLDDVAPLWLALPLAALLFGLVHFESAQVVVGTTIIGAGLILVYRHSKNLWVPIIVHAINNFLVISLIHLGYLT